MAEADPEHTCNNTVRGASTCPACLSRPIAGAPPAERFKRMEEARRRAPDPEKFGRLKPYSDESEKW